MTYILIYFFLLAASLHSQMMVLDGTDFSKVEIDVILVETNRRGMDAINKNDVLDWFTSRGDYNDMTDTFVRLIFIS
jgi:hypothetical protein